MSSGKTMTDNEITKNSGEINSNKIKAIYPHIVVSGDVDKPYYSIQWYDIEKKTMFDGYASYELKFVREWLQENFEVVETDIDNLINRQQAEVERLQKENNQFADIGKMYSEIKAEAIKEFAERLKEKAKPHYFDNYAFAVPVAFIDNLVKEMVGDAE